MIFRFGVAPPKLGKAAVDATLDSRARHDTLRTERKSNGYLGAKQWVFDIFTPWFGSKILRPQWRFMNCLG